MCHRGVAVRQHEVVFTEAGKLRSSPQVHGAPAPRRARRWCS
jgi:hypothetical protein